MVVRAALGVSGTGAARGLSVSLLLRRWFLVFVFGLFFVSGFSAIGDFGQKLPNVFDLFFAPNVGCRGAGGEQLRSWHFPHGNVMSQCRGCYSEFLGRFTSGVTFHYRAIVCNSSGLCQDVPQKSAGLRVTNHRLKAVVLVTDCKSCSGPKAAI